MALLSWALPRRDLIFAAAAVAVVATVFAAASLPRTFLPPFNEGTLDVSLQYNPGISLHESNRLGLIAEQLLMGMPEVASVGRRTGRAELDEHAEGVHFSEIDVDLKSSLRPRDEILARHTLTPCGLAGIRQRRATHRAPDGPYALRNSRGNRAEDLRR